MNDDPTKLDLFAALAMHALLTLAPNEIVLPGSDERRDKATEQLASMAFNVAEKMVDESERRQPR